MTSVMNFYPEAARLPESKATDRLLLRPLRASDAERDYDAVMSSAAMLRRWSQSDWPADDFTLAENRSDLERHEREHRERVAFTFTVLDPQGTTCLGCTYIMPLRPEEASLCAGAGHAARVGFWVRASERSDDLEKHLLTTLREWLRTEWAFDAVVFTVYQDETRQASLMAGAGLVQRLTFTRPDGRRCCVFA